MKEKIIKFFSFFKKRKTNNETPPINTADICTELEKRMDDVAQQLKDNFKDVMHKKSAAIYLCFDSLTEEPVSFAMDIILGKPVIQLVYNGCVCQLRGSCGPNIIVKDIDNKICETILDYLAQG